MRTRYLFLCCLTLLGFASSCDPDDTEEVDNSDIVQPVAYGPPSSFFVRHSVANDSATADIAEATADPLNDPQS
jgi:hypothetical protein